MIFLVNVPRLAGGMQSCIFFPTIFSSFARPLNGSYVLIFSPTCPGLPAGRQGAKFDRSVNSKAGIEL